MMEKAFDTHAKLHYEYKKGNFESKKNIYEIFLSYFPQTLTTMPAEFISNIISWWTADTAKRSVCLKEKYYRESLEAYAESEDKENLFIAIRIGPDNIYKVKSEYQNLQYLNQKIEEYIEEYDEVITKLNEFKKSGTYNLFELYASQKVKDSLEEFEVAYHNAYYTSWGGYKISLIYINFLRDRVIASIKDDLKVSL